jgi:phosphate-selective porin OprO and OprP
MKYLVTLLLFFSAATGFSQEKTAIEESLAYFKDGVIFEHKPTHFKTRFRFRIQNRFTYESEEAEKLSAKAVDFTVRRMRMRLEGTVLDPRLLYKVQLSFTRGDMDFDRTNYPNILRDAVVGWKISDATTIWYGQTKLPGNRQRVISSGEQQFVDRSLLNTTFNIDRDLGAQLYHKMGQEKPLSVKLAVSNGEGRATENKDNGLAYTGRIEWLPMGEFQNEGDYFESDLVREPEPKISLGAVYSVNKNATRPGGQLGRQFTTPGLNRDIETWFADLLYKHQGFSWSTEYARRWTSDPVFTDGTSTVTVYKGQGISTQAGYVLENNIEPALRFTRIWGEKATLSGENDQNQFTAALSKYINKHRIKVQTDLTYAEQENRVKNLSSSNWIYRLQLEIGI